MERFFQALQNLTKWEFLAIFVEKLRPYKGNPHDGGFGLKEGTKVELQRFSVFCQICSHPLQKLMLAMRYMQKKLKFLGHLSNRTFSDSKIKGYMGRIWANWGLK